MGRRLFFIGFIVSPLAVLALLMWLIAGAIERGPQMENQRVGAGAGDTGGANAIGEMLAGDKSDAPAPDDASDDGNAGGADEDDQ